MTAQGAQDFLLRSWDPLSLWTMQPATSPRMNAAFSRAWTAKRDFIRESIDYPTIRPEKGSLIAHR